MSCFSNGRITRPVTRQDSSPELGFVNQIQNKTMPVWGPGPRGGWKCVGGSGDVLDIILDEEHLP